MKKILLIVAAALVSGHAAAAQEAASGASHKERYERQVRNVGTAGAGVGLIIEKWEADCPDDVDMLSAKFSYNYAKSMSEGVVTKSTPRYMGAEPVLSLKDSTGADVYYFQGTVFDDELFAVALNSVSRAAELEPLELRHRFDKISALLAYEKDSPDLGMAEIVSLVDEYSSSRTAGWKIDGEEIVAGPKTIAPEFSQAMGEYCYALFKAGSPQAYEYFFTLSKTMNRLDPKSTVFVDNMGSYWQVAHKNLKKAEKYYKKALKMDPEDYVAIQNMRIIRTLKSRKGQSSK